MYSETLKVYFCILILIVLLNYSLYYRQRIETVVLQQNSNYRPIYYTDSHHGNAAQEHIHDATHQFKMHTLTGYETTPAIKEDNSESASLHEARESSEESVRLSTWPTTDTTVVTVVTEPETKPIKSTHVVTVLNQLMTNSANRLSESPATNIITKNPSTGSTVHQNSLDKSKSKAPIPQGYVMVMKVYEQQTMASGNLLQLQCWAKFLNLLVVKPFMHDSHLSTPLDEQKQALMVKFEDIFNITDWNNYVTQQEYAPFKEWQQFLREAPRNVIYVQFRYLVQLIVKAKRSQGLPFPHPPEGKYYMSGCKFKALGRESTFLTANGFKTVRNVCFNFLNGDEPSLEEFSRHLLGDYAPGEVTIIINEWRGLGEPQRVLIRERICTEENAFREQIRPSLRVIRDAEQYRQQFLGGKDYLAVMVRLEMTAITRRAHDSTSNDPHYIIPYCIQLTEQIWREYKSKTNLDKTFLSIDIGKYGSDSFKRHNYYGHLKEMINFVSAIYDGNMTVQEWEKTFDDVAQNTDPSYIAMLQKVIVTRARCIIFVGGGSFQRHALHLYQQLHPNPEYRCIIPIKKCTSSSRPIQ